MTEELIVWLMVIVGYDQTIADSVNKLANPQYQVRIAAHKSLRQAGPRALPLCRFVVQTPGYPTETARRCERLLDDIVDDAIPASRYLSPYGRVVRGRFSYASDDVVVKHYLDRACRKWGYLSRQISLAWDEPSPATEMRAIAHQAATKIAVADRLLLGQSPSSIQQWLDKLEVEEREYARRIRYSMENWE